MILSRLFSPRSGHVPGTLSDLFFEAKHPLCIHVRRHTCNDCLSTDFTTIEAVVFNRFGSESILITDAAGRNGDWNGKREGESEFGKAEE